VTRPLVVVLMVAGPLLWAVLAPFHPDPTGPNIFVSLEPDVERWLFVHISQLVLAPFVAFTVWMMLRGLGSFSANLSRASLAVWLVFFSAYDALAGIGTGVLVREAENVSGQERAGFAAAADFFWNSRLSGHLSWLGIVATIAWPVVALAAAVALRRGGFRWATVTATALSGLIALHGGFPASIGFAALAVAAVLWSRDRRSSAVSSEALPAV
jgi:hypothetical protein